MKNRQDEEPIVSYIASSSGILRTGNIYVYDGVFLVPAHEDIKYRLKGTDEKKPLSSNYEIGDTIELHDPDTLDLFVELDIWAIFTAEPMSFFWEELSPTFVEWANENQDGLLNEQSIFKYPVFPNMPNNQIDVTLDE
tara:strand:- start:4882 stop:5295 length:414 start_codon:yes stop_codon:yes gene_type:complete